MSNIPEGFAYRRCDNIYTKDEFISRCSMEYDDGSTCNLAGKRSANPFAVAYVKKNPKSEYTSKDVMAVLRMECEKTVTRNNLR